MLERLQIRSFKALQDAGIPLRPLTALIGPNGAGKSTILQAVEMLGALVRSTLPEYLSSHHWDYADLPHLRSPHWQIEFVAHLRFGSRQLGWQLALGKRRHGGIAYEVVFDRTTGKVLLKRRGRAMERLNEATRKVEPIEQTLTSSWLAALDPKEDAKRFPTLLQVANWARAIRGYFFLDPLTLRTSGRGEPDEIGPHGEDLAPFLRRLRSRDKVAFNRVVERVRKQYPQLVEVKTPSKRFGWTELELTERWNSESATFNARQVSDGLLRMLAVSAMHELPERPSVLLLDEIENGLHPHLLGGFVELVRSLVQASKGKTQVIFTTHSPITINFFEDPADVVLVTRAKHGQARVLPLSEAKNIKELRKHFDLGELWYNVGEKRLT